jgi:hypothetical protein
MLMNDEWQFPDPPETAAYATTRVLDGSRPLRYVLHDDDGDWQFLCGTTSAKCNIKMVCLTDLITLFPHAAHLADLPAGYAAEWLPDENLWEAGPNEP